MLLLARLCLNRPRTSSEHAVTAEAIPEQTHWRIVWQVSIWALLMRIPALIIRSNLTIQKTRRHKFSRGAWGGIVSTSLLRT